MKVAVGATVLERGVQTGHIDGIGTYTQQLLEQYAQLELMHVQPYVLDNTSCSLSKALRAKTSFKYNVLQSTFLMGRPFSGVDNLLGCDLFHSTDHLIPKLKNAPVLATLMDPVPLMHPEWVSGGGRWLKNWLFKRSTQWADHYVTISNSVVDDLVRFFGVDENKLTVVPLGVDDDYFNKVGEIEQSEVLGSLNLERGFFLFIGTLQPRKNVKSIISAFLALPEAVQKSHPLVIAGRNGWRADEEVAILKDLENRGVARWLDYVTPQQKKVLLQSALGLVFPSLYEGFGLPVLEAFASGLPVIASNTTSLIEVASDSALLVNPLDVKEIADAMLTLVMDASVAKDLSRRGEVRARLYTWEKTARATWALYQTVTK